MYWNKDVSMIDLIKERMSDLFEYGEDGLAEYNDSLCKEFAEKLSPYLVGYVIKYLEKDSCSFWKTPENEVAVRRLSEMIENAYATYREKELDEAHHEIEKLKLSIKDKNKTIESIRNERMDFSRKYRESQNEIKNLEEKLLQAQELVRKHDIISLEDLYQGKAFK